MQKTTWGTLNRRWVPHDLRDVVVDFLRSLHQRSGVALSRLIDWLGIDRPKYYDWQTRYGKVNE